MAKGPAVKEEREARERRLQVAIEHDAVDELHNLIVEERELLNRVSKHPFPNTPLHIAAAAGKTDVAMEMAILKPSFARKLNPEGYSPMHLALQHEQYHTVRALMTLDPKLIRVRGRGGITPLHFVAGEKENEELLELLAEFLSACKSSIENLTSQCETAVHIAVKNNNLKAFKVLLGWLKRVHLTEILNWKDKKGNTVLHIAVYDQRPEIIELLIGYIQVNAKNLEGKTALKIFQVNPSGSEDLAKRLCRVRCLAGLHNLNLSQSEFLSKELTIFEKFTFCFGLRDESARDIILLVAALVMTATYQAALTPPGGYWQDNSSNPPVNSNGIAAEKPHQAGNIIMNGSSLYVFTALNSAVFLASIITIWITAIPLLPHTSTVYLLMWILSASYFANLMIEFPKFDVIALVFIKGFYMCLLGVGLVVPMYLKFKYIPFLRGIDATQRRLGNFQELKDRK